MLDWNVLEQRSYTPYSRKPAYTLCIDEKNELHPGVRIENAAFPETISSIQSAIYGCIAQGRKPEKLLLPFVHSDESFQLDYLVEQYGISVVIDSEIPQLPLVSPFIHLDKIKIEYLKNLIPLTQTKHSDFPVTALLLTEYGYVAGVNIENQDWRLGLCAERVAISRAISNGAKELLDFHVFAPKAEYCSPCGGCRQVIMEHLPEQRMFMYHKDETHSEIIAKYLLPHSFSINELKNR
jgi:homotetrameric cytidine deaminase